MKKLCNNENDGAFEDAMETPRCQIYKSQTNHENLELVRFVEKAPPKHFEMASS